MKNIEKTQRPMMVKCSLMPLALSTTGSVLTLGYPAHEKPLMSLGDCLLIAGIRSDPVHYPKNGVAYLQDSYPLVSYA